MEPSITAVYDYFFNPVPDKGIVKDHMVIFEGTTYEFKDLNLYDNGALIGPMEMFGSNTWQTMLTQMTPGPHALQVETQADGTRSNVWRFFVDLSDQEKQASEPRLINLKPPVKQ
ncbi:hypothetical protein HKK52_15075 [Pseudomonas sp. ADAK2]|uniref:hypothetical protein n=1 Tax=unclassified Pseudomonas TaxID=196821 RepID=UPI0014634AE8|nr:MULTISPECIES: hypothetical protein [unclassified Pseudomonas]QJI42196.1 hypothetical protein HKK53_15080 [Pseudomonas sp. ADAK7]QJI48499.1 hypothetical protein HKK52_15075 [Pseudomonas sp. ADAK2]